jgi:hypothetical protein
VSDRELGWRRGRLTSEDLVGEWFMRLQWLVRLLWTVLAAVVALLLAASPARAAPDPSPTAVKYYVVSPSIDGQPEYLYEIAVKTLGNGNRYLEIFDLNQGRTQPDGGTLTDPLRLQPGWILLLPRDAKGSGVRFGILPTPSPRPSVSPSSPAPSPSTAESHAPAPAVSNQTLIQGVGLVLAVLLLMLAMTLLRPRARRAAPAPFSPPVTTILPPDPRPVPAAAPTELAPTELAPAESSPTESGPAQSRPAQSRPAQSGPAQSGPAQSGPAQNRPTESGPAGFPELTAPAGFPELVATVDSAGDVLRVSLLGARTGGPGPAFGWCAPGQAPPTIGVPVLLGSRDGHRLFADLSRTPDVLAVSGPPDAARRLAARLAAQLLDAGLAVDVVGAALGPRAPRGVQQLTGLLTRPPAPGGPRRVIVSEAQDADARRAVRGLLADGGGDVLSIVVGEAARARWSVRVAVDTPADKSGSRRPRTAVG